MADQILNNTLTGTLSTQVPEIPKGLTVPDTGNTIDSMAADIQKLQSAQQQPSSLVQFQKAMQLSSQLAYKDRQTQELGVESKAFDPTKVSGGTFAGIIQNLEAQRGADVGKIYASTLNAYASAQEQITNRLQFLQQLQESKKQFDAEMKLKKKQIKEEMRINKEAAKLKKKEFEMAQSQWEREFALQMQKAKASTGTAGVYPDTGNYRATYQSIPTNTTYPTQWNNQTNTFTSPQAFDINAFLGQ